MKRIHNKDDIVQAGLDIILSKGFNATGVEAILKQANVPKGSFYNFFSSKEEFGLAIIDRYIAEINSRIFQPILEEDSLPPLQRIRKCFESLISLFESNDCSKGCLIGNLSLEMSDQYEKVRQRLDLVLQRWADIYAALLLQAKRENALPSELDVEMLAENMIASYEGALLRAKVKKSSEPLRNFIHLYFDKFLALKE
ncbi:MAG: TetR family transcriptional regulator C-terminal domain-containing protein [Geobacteraceae bacterium]|nr:TetR family transcriptional regulator C-terminal domain-containing protein [Geobacteraceae bacterium]